MKVNETYCTNNFGRSLNISLIFVILCLFMRMNKTEDLKVKIRNNGYLFDRSEGDEYDSLNGIYFST